MSALLQTFGEMRVVYAAVSVINTMLMTWFCLIAVPVVFRVKLRRQPLLWALAGLLCVAVGVTRFWRGDPEANRFINWEFFNTILPYACVLLVVPIRQIWKGLAAALGVPGRVTSPTFCIVQEHKSENVLLVHMDLYRLHGEDDVEAIGWEDYLARGAIFVIEWPERAGSLIPQSARRVEFRHLGEERRLVSIDKRTKIAL